MLAKKNVTYLPNNKVIELDPVDRRVIMDKGEKLRYDLVSIIPPNKAAAFVKDSGLGDPFIDVDPGSFRSKKYDGIFAVGDCARVPYTKSAYTASIEGKNAAHYVARAMGYEVRDPEPVHNICYPYVSSDEALLVRVDWDREGKVVKTVADEAKRDYRRARSEWEHGLLRELFGA